MLAKQGTLAISLPLTSLLSLFSVELLLRRPWFPGNNDIDQLGRIFQVGVGGKKKISTRVSKMSDRQRKCELGGSF